jgi:hypothetical protein
VITE